MITSFMHFVDGLTTVIHEYLHGWQYLKSFEKDKNNPREYNKDDKFSSSGERELFTHYFKVFPNRFMNWFAAQYGKRLCIDFPELDDSYKYLERLKYPRKAQLALDFQRNWDKLIASGEYNNLPTFKKIAYKRFKDEIDDYLMTHYGILPNYRR